MSRDMRSLSLSEAANRGVNLVAVISMGVIGFSMLSLISGEDGWSHRADEIAIAVLAIAMIVWYFAGQNRFARSWVPVGLLGLGFVIKVIGIIIEHNDKDDLGNDIGLVQIFFLLTVLVGWQVYRNQRLTDSAVAAAAGDSGSSSLETQ